MKPWSFAFATDVHIGSPRSFRFQPAWNDNWQTARRQLLELQPDFLLLGGDLGRDGIWHRQELEAAKADFDDLPFPCRAVPGNMDVGNKFAAGPGPRRHDPDLNITSAALAQYREVFGPSEWSMVHRDVRVTGFCTMLAGSGLPEEDAFWDWLEQQREEPRARHHVWVTHSPLFVDAVDEGNYEISDGAEYNSWYFNTDEPHRSRLIDVLKATGAELVLAGHVHCRKDHYADGIHYHIGASTAFKQWGDHWPDGDDTLGFLLVDVTETGLEPHFVPLDCVASKAGYGPGGHPQPELHDYSLAWEKPAFGE